MAILSIPELHITIRDPREIREFFDARNLFFDQWSCDVIFDDGATQEEILEAYSKDLQPFMQRGGYKTADVISINSLTENYEAIRNKFLSEHTHSEDEIRFFVDGQGLFWFNLEGEPVFNLLCEKGDLISVPAGTKHWFDAGATAPFVKAIRIFIDTTGWIPEYTDSKKEQLFKSFQLPLQERITFVLTDIEGTTTAINYVYDVLFPYFRENSHWLKELINDFRVKEAFSEAKKLAFDIDNQHLETDNEVIEKLNQWSREDRKYTPLKVLQGIIWEKGYLKGALKGHVYPDVEPFLNFCKSQKIQLGVFSSGSVQAQQLIFEHSSSGNLSGYFSAYFDTKTGEKRNPETYSKISRLVDVFPKKILFLSDVSEELEAAMEAGFQTIQLVREGNTENWNRWVSDFKQLEAIIGF